ncbi:unnamed protein product [Bursaphelenchus okinawaensis]|uniref:Tyrosine-protein phosphatase domain-containing protein n=1 Tax=Bursaphelenchus okinawaensis TaxID=465554 RepID=A0A811K9L8_9BILA|nr:unnamed protein product [Bursaphelenchus okinawaensis]CAG9095230.1 unnamed protein product [Bursaphelenchus okinawaensis]
MESKRSKISDPKPKPKKKKEKGKDKEKDKDQVSNMTPTAVSPGPGGKKKKPKLLQKANNAEEVRGQWVSGLIDKGTRKLVQEFNELHHNGAVDCATFLAPENVDKNKYPDIYCLEATRVRLPNDEYYHANYVATAQSSTRFICAQSPKENTAETFWSMIINEKVEAIIMMSKFSEKNQTCFPYFSQEAGAAVICGNWKVFTHEKTNMKEFEAIYRFTVSIKNQKNPKAPRPRVIIHQWTDWPAYGMPEASLSLMNILQSVRGSKNPIVVHCDDGVGRSGVFVMVEQFYELLMAGHNASDTLQMLKELRAQRWGCIVHEIQYLYVFRILFFFFMARKCVDLSQVLLEFIDDYDAAHKKFVQAEKDRGGGRPQLVVDGKPLPPPAPSPKQPTPRAVSPAVTAAAPPAEPPPPVSMIIIPGMNNIQCVNQPAPRPVQQQQQPQPVQQQQQQPPQQQQQQQLGGLPPPENNAPVSMFLPFK